MKSAQVPTWRQQGPMTSDEIKESRPAEHSTNTWLKEVAYQLALLNENQPITNIPHPMELVNRKKIE